ncbi:MAG: MFS transporter [Firmicutes bacterium]|nr:MFS transporter [Bacillota bacterium]
MSEHVVDKKKRLFFFNEQTALQWALAAGESLRQGFAIILIPQFVTEIHHWGYGLNGWALAIYYFSDIMARLISGPLMDRHSTWRVLRLPILIAPLGTAFALLSNHPWGVLVGACLLGASLAPIWPATFQSITRENKENASAQLGAVMALWLIATGIGVGSFAALSYLHIPGIAIVAIIWSFLPMVFLHLTTHPPVVGSISRPAFREATRQSRLLLPGMFLQTAATSAITPVAWPWVQHLGIPLLQLAILAVIIGGLTVAVLSPLGKIADRGALHPFLFGGLFAIAIGVAAISWSTTLWQLALAGTLMGFSYACFQPAWNGLQARIIPPQAEAGMWGLFMGIEGIGNTVGSAAGGWIADAAGPRTVFWLSAAIFTVLALFYFLLPVSHLLESNTPRRKDR